MEPATHNYGKAAATEQLFTSSLPRVCWIGAKFSHRILGCVKLELLVSLLQRYILRGKESISELYVEQSSTSSVAWAQLPERCFDLSSSPKAPASVAVTEPYLGSDSYWQQDTLSGNPWAPFESCNTLVEAGVLCSARCPVVYAVHYERRKSSSRKLAIRHLLCRGGSFSGARVSRRAIGPAEHNCILA